MSLSTKYFEKKRSEIEMSSYRILAKNNKSINKSKVTSIKKTGHNE